MTLASMTLITTKPLLYHFYADVYIYFDKRLISVRRKVFGKRVLYIESAMYKTYNSIKINYLG